MACQCGCCKGACCYDFAGQPTCSFESCTECEALSGKFQGNGTECTGEQDDECPCDPPADHLLCEKCVSSAPADRCPEGQYCCDGVCQEEPCGTPCSMDADCSYNQASCSDLGGCEADGTTVRLFPDTAQGLLDALDYINALDPGSCGACTVDPGPGKCCDDLCYPDVGDLPGFYTLPLACP